MSLLIEEQNAEYLKNLLQFVREMRLRPDSIAASPSLAETKWLCLLFVTGGMPVIGRRLPSDDTDRKRTDKSV